jgi:hypothetical protein
VMMRRRVGLEPVARTAGVVARITLAAAVAAALGYGAWYALDDWLGRSVGAELVSLALSLAVVGLAYAAAARTLRVRELETLLLLRARRDEP